MRKLILLLVVLTAALLAGCNKGGTNQNSTDMRALNAVIDSEPVDVLVDADVKFAAVAPNTATGYANFTSGTREVLIRSATNQATLYDKQVQFTSDSRSTILIYGHRSGMATLIMPDDTTAPSSGKARVRFVGLSADTGPVDVYITSTSALTGPAFITGAQVGVVTTAGEVTGGGYQITVTSAGTQDVLFQSSTAFNFASGNNYTLAIVPSLGGKLVNAMVIEPGATGAITVLNNPISRVKAVNAIPDSNGLNFKADGSVILTAVPYTGVSSYVNSAGGAHNLQIEQSNVPGTNIASLSTTLTSARDYTLLASGTVAAPQLTLITDDNSPPAIGNVKIRFVNAISNGNVDALVNFASQAQGIAPKSASSYYTIVANTNYTITFTTPGGVNVIASLTGVELDAGNIYTVYVFGTTANAQAKLVRDR
jgi:outer membrane murein-binding lipoprotein Lpp